LLKLNNISKSFSQPTGNTLHLFSDVSFIIENKVKLALLGPNGCGKTTLLRLIAGEIQQDNGTIFIENIDLINIPVYKRSKYIGYVNQDSYRSLASDLTVGEILSIASKKKEPLKLKMPCPRKAISEINILSPTLSKFLSERTRIPTCYLSGGQRQLLAIAIAVLCNPKIILLDEHTASLDEKYKKEVDYLFNKIALTNDTAILCATHDRKWAQTFADQYALFKDNKIILSKTL